MRGRPMTNDSAGPLLRRIRESVIGDDWRSPSTSLCRRHPAPGSHGVGVRRERRIGKARVLVEARPFTRPAETPHGEVRREMTTPTVPCGFERPRCRHRCGVGDAEPDGAPAGPREPDHGVPARRCTTATLRTRDRGDRHSRLRRELPLAEPGVSPHRPQHRTGELVGIRRADWLVHPRRCVGVLARNNVHADHVIVFAEPGPVRHRCLCTTPAHGQTLWTEPTGQVEDGSDRGQSPRSPSYSCRFEPHVLLTCWEAAGTSRGRSQKIFSGGGGDVDAAGVSPQVLQVLVRRVGAASQQAEPPRRARARGRSRGEPGRGYLSGASRR